MPIKNTNLFSDKWQWPRKHIHEIWKPVRVRWAIKLSNIHYIIFIFQNGGLNHKRRMKQQPQTVNTKWSRKYADEFDGLAYLVVVHIQIVWSRKYRNQRWKTCCLTFSIHSISADFHENDETKTKSIKISWWVGWNSNPSIKCVIEFAEVKMLDKNVWLIKCMWVHVCHCRYRFGSSMEIRLHTHLVGIVAHIYPASCASCALIIDSKLLFWRKSQHAA